MTSAFTEPGSGSSQDDQWHKLLQFRATHPTTTRVIHGTTWEYIACGRGIQSVLILPGLLGFGEMTFQHIQGLEEQYRVLVPSYPFSLPTMAQLVDGIAAILQGEGVSLTHVLGGSYGGMVAQVFVRRYPERVDRLVLSHTGSPKRERAAQSRRVIAVMRWLPMDMLHRIVRLATRTSLKAAPEHIPFRTAYGDEMIARLTKADLISRYRVAADFDATSQLTPHDLDRWPGRILILEGDDDPIAEAPARQSLRTAHPRAEIHTFHGTGHIASIAKVDDYLAVIKAFLAAP